MTAFFALAAMLLVVAVAIVLRPLLRRPVDSRIGRGKSNLEIHRDQYAELERDLASGALNDETYRQARLELEKRVLEDAATSDAVQQPAKPARATAIAIGAAIPVIAFALYLYLGNLQGIVATPHPAKDLSSVTAEQFEQMTAGLAERMKKNPADLEGWKMLGRAYRVMERYGEASGAYRKAVELRPDDADLLGDLAETLALAAGRSMAGEPTRLLDRALKLQPNNTKILALSGSAAFERKDYKTAIHDWEAILKQPGADPELAQALQKGVDEARARLSGKPMPVIAAGKERVAGEVSLDPALASKAGPDDAVFIFARAADGPRMPLAIVKVKVRDLPYRFSFDDSSAMMPDMKLSKFNEVVVGARVSKSGAATPTAGDLAGQSATVKPGTTGVKVRIDRQVPAP